jgi:predicted nucleotidyltransferase
MTISWAVTPDKVQAAIQRIIEISKPKKLILFGSYVAGKTHEHSDLDVLVVTGDEDIDPRKESVRIRRALRGALMPMDILVVPEGRLRELADAPGLIYREILRTGRVVYESAA